jgi:energy-coupling factor transporter ATP-binding protein EcfA2
VHTTFTPGTPISNLDLLAGRDKQIDKVLETVFSPGQHAAIYGERGVGKSSLANLIYDIIFATGKENFIPVRVNCSNMVSFHEIWREIFRQIQMGSAEGEVLMEDQVSDTPNSEDIRRIFEQASNPSIVVIDEFDRVDATTASAMSDTIKTLSDRAVDTTLVIAGVGDSLEQLIHEHQSIDRAIIQIPMQRMSRDELIAIVTKGLARISELTIEAGLDKRMAEISKGLPHYMHLLAKHSALSAISNGRREIIRSDYEYALKTSTEDKSQTLGHAYLNATHSAKESLFEEVLLACALATDVKGFFGAKDVRAPLAKIMKKPVKIEAYIRHLDKFSQEPRGPILKKEGQKRRFQYSFIDPMMQPYVLMKGITEGKITEEQLRVLSDSASASGPPYEQLSFDER